MDGALAAEIGLEIGHEESGGDAFAGDVADDEAEAVVTEAEEVVIVATDLAGLMANAGVVECSELGEILRKEAGLDLLGNIDFLGGALFSFEALLLGAALGFHGVSDFIEADKRENVAVGIAETAEDAAPEGGFAAERLDFGGFVRLDPDAVLETPEAWIAGEVHAASDPFAELAGDIFGDKGDVGVASDEFEISGIASGRREDQIGLAVGRADDHPAAAGAIAGVKDQLKAESFRVEGDTAIQIADEDGDGLQAEEGVGGDLGHGGIISPESWRWFATVLQ